MFSGNNVAMAVAAELAGIKTVHDDLHLLIGSSSTTGDRYVLDVCCSYKFGGYCRFAILVIDGDGDVLLRLLTAYGIVYGNPMYSKWVEELQFTISDPEFPGNLIGYLGSAASNAQRAHELKHKRSWSRSRQGSRSLRVK